MSIEIVVGLAEPAFGMAAVLLRSVSIKTGSYRTGKGVIMDALKPRELIKKVGVSNSL